MSKQWKVGGPSGKIASNDRAENTRIATYGRIFGTVPRRKVFRCAHLRRIATPGQRATEYGRTELNHMLEPLSILVALNSWLLKKGADSAWNRIYRYFRPSALALQIESALRSDAAVGEVCQPPPTLDRRRLTEERTQILLRTAITGEFHPLRDYLLNEQLIDLPMCANKQPSSYDAVWKCVANAVLQAVCAAVAKDEQLLRQFLVVSQQLGHVEHQQILTELLASSAQSQQANELLIDKLDAIERKLPEHSTTIALSDTTVVRSINLLSRENEQLEQQLREQLDRNTERLWDDILEQIQHHNFCEAIVKGQELAEWLKVQGPLLSDAVRGRAYLLLAQVALIESSEWGELQDGYSKSHELFERARDEFGDPIPHENVLRLANFQAKLLFLDGRVGEALSVLSHATDPQSVATRLSIHIDQDEIEKGIALVQSLPLDEKWCEFAVFLYARAGDTPKAHEALQRAHGSRNRSLDNSCRVAYARATLTRLINRPSDRQLTLLAIDEAVAQEVEDVLRQLEPITQACRGRGTVETGLEADAVGLAYTCWRILHRPAEARAYVALLHDRHPVHLDYAYAVLQGDVDLEAGIADLIRSHYPNYFAAQDLALGIDCWAGTAPHLILDHVVAATRLAKTTDERTRLARTLVQASANAGTDVQSRAEGLAIQLVGKDHFLVHLLEANRYFKGGDIDGFERVLNELEGEEDFSVEQFRAQLRLKKGDYSQAAEILEAVGRRMAEPDLLKDAARIAAQAKPVRLDIVIRALEDVLILSPTDVAANRHLASAYVQLRGFAAAAACFQRLRDIEPEQPVYALNQAKCLVLANRPQEALAIQDELCSAPEAPLEAHLARSVLLSHLGQPKKAFTLLHAIRDEHWDAPAFVVIYMNTGHAANRDRYAHEAFQQLWQLREAGKAPPEILQPKSLQDFIQLAEESQNQRNLLQDQLLTGQLPWLFVERLLNNVPYWGWRIRTQPLSWCFDDARHRASMTIYATNSYAVLPDGDTRQLRRVQCSPRGQAVVADLSALITLHRLGLLGAAIEYFGAVHIPPSYLSEVVEQSGRLRPHQLSQKSDPQSIKAMLDAGRIHVLPEKEGSADAKLVCEYGADGEQRRYSICDVLNALLRHGRISRQQFDDAASVAHKPAMASTLGGEIEPANHITVDLRTLQTIAGEGLLPALCDTFDRVSITIPDSERLTGELRHFEALAETQAWHDDLWAQLRADHRVHDSTMALYPSHDEEDGDASADEAEMQHILAMDAAFLAQQEQLPLVVDDRMCQNMVLRSRDQSADAAFGIDCLLIALLDAGLIENREAATAFLQLIEWRYRFLLVPPQILRTIASEFAKHDLRKVARYVHDCMRDMGLFGGPEPTQPPIPIAYRYYQDWLQTIAEFVVTLWLDGNVTDEQASSLTRWAMTELVPTVPTVLGARIGRIADVSAFAMLHHAMLRLCHTPEYSRANVALRGVAEALGLSNDDFVRTAADIINSHA